MGCCLRRCGMNGDDGQSFSPHAAALLGSPRQSVQVGALRLQRGKQVGEGGFSYVWLCRDAGPPEREVALKLTTVDAEEEADLRHVVAEAEMLRDLRHENIIAYCSHEVRDTAGGRRKEILLAMEACPSTVRDEMAARLGADGLLPLHRCLSVMFEVTAGIAYMHGQQAPVAHRDLKVENVLVTQDGVCKLCDFGSATTLARECRTKLDIATAEEEIQRHTTLQYRAPEQIDLWQKRRVDEKVDCWALGVMLFYMVFMSLPFEEQPLQITNCSYSVPEHTAEQCSAGVVDLIRKLLVPDPAARPDVWQVSEAVAGLSSAVSPDKPMRWPVPRPDPVPRQQDACANAHAGSPRSGGGGEEDPISRRSSTGAPVLRSE